MAKSDTMYDHLYHESCQILTNILSHFSCRLLLQKDGVYTLQDPSTPEKFQAYCHMTEIPGCGQGGWTLVMKVDGRKVMLIRNLRIIILITYRSYFILVSIAILGLLEINLIRPKLGLVITLPNLI